ncbi:MAG: prepilin-type N-terminal cleavage/methylation domain-containing protein [Chloroflexi bacterium]|nr:prepilin-type N-terminal cleavage/methylation domain-containing protein [Chloroflexota bacterium]
MRIFGAEFQRKDGGFTLVELLVVVAIIVALAAASVVAVGRFAGKGEEGARASEAEAVQAAMDTMMAENSIAAVTANDLTTTSNGVQDFAAVPSEGALSGYMRKNPTVYFYCWDSTGKVKQLAASGACPAGPY